MGATQKLLRFGLFELNLDTEELRKDGIPLKLPPQPFRILVLLAGRAGQIVTRDEIRQQIWGGETFVDFEHGLNQCIKQIRTALNDNADAPLYVETVPRRGYRFLAPVTSKTVAEPPPRVVESKSGIQQNVVSSAIAVLEARSAADAGDHAAQPPTVASRVVIPLPVASVRDPKMAEKNQPLPELSRKKMILWSTLAAVAILVFVAGGIYWNSHRNRALPGNGTLVLADFTNTTGDPVFNDVLKMALTTNLQQSRFLHVLSDQKVRAVLKAMDLPENERLTPEVTRELCQRTKSTAMVASSIADDGNKYQIQLQALNCQTGATLATVNEEAENRNLIIHALGMAGSQLRSQLGESGDLLRASDKPLDQALSSSPEALQSFSDALKAQSTGGNILPYLQHAVELDPDFASAYMALGVVYRNLGQTQLANQNLTKAYEYRQRLSDQGRLLIEAIYYTDVTGDLEKAIQTYEELEKRFPDNYTYHGNRAIALSALGRYEEALAEEQEGIRLAPNHSVGYSNLMYYYNSLDRLDDSLAAFEAARKRNLEGVELHVNRYSLAFLQHDNAAMQEQSAWSAGKSGGEDRLLSLQSDTEAFYGRFRAARELSRKATEAATHAAVPELAATWKATAALREAEIGNGTQAQQLATEALSLSTGRNVTVLAAMVFARSGNVTEAQKLVTELNQEFPLDTLMQNYSLPSIRAAIVLNSGRPGAVDLLEVTKPYQLASPTAFSNLYPAYLRGQAYLKSGQPERAAEEFKVMLENPGVTQNFVTGSLAHLQIARAQAMSGDTAAARKSYQEFFALWKDADSDIPILKEARSEYARLP